MFHPLESTLALLAGLATVASPCVLPVLPILLGVSVDRPGRARPLLIVAGFVLSFSGFVLALGAVSSGAQLAQETLRDLALAMLAATGLLRIWPQPYDRLVAQARVVLARLRGRAADAPPAAPGQG
ncbi:MAG TPA: cytochrome c biogenesis protein CcdA, partial [Telluria sp.]